MGNLIMPKADGQIQTCIETLKILSTRKGWTDNEDFKKKIADALNKPRSSDGPFLIKKSETARYFGLVEYDFKLKKMKITERGEKFLALYLQGNVDGARDLVMESILNDSFGKNNYAIKTSDSIIDPPKVLLKAVFDKMSLDNKQLGYLLYCLHDKGIGYTENINNLFSSKEIVLPANVRNKYADLKFREFLINMGIIEESMEGKYKISDYIYEKYAKEIEVMSVYNDFEQEESYVNTIEDNIDEEIVIKVPVYPKEMLDKINNRIPKVMKTSWGGKYMSDYRVSKTSLQLASYKCEFDNGHDTFTTRYGFKYMEAHHLIPMSFQKEKPDVNIDRIENIVSLCPNCHKAIHYGNKDVIVRKMKTLYEKRISILKKTGLEYSLNSILKLYSL